jgi:hypothetical protein
MRRRTRISKLEIPGVEGAGRDERVAVDEGVELFVEVLLGEALAQGLALERHPRRIPREHRREGRLPVGEAAEQPARPVEERAVAEDERRGRPVVVHRLEQHAARRPDDAAALREGLGEASGRVEMRAGRGRSERAQQLVVEEPDEAAMARTIQGREAVAQRPREGGPARERRRRRCGRW